MTADRKGMYLYSTLIGNISLKALYRVKGRESIVITPEARAALWETDNSCTHLHHAATFSHKSVTLLCAFPIRSLQSRS